MTQLKWEALVWQPLSQFTTIHPVSNDRSEGRLLSFEFYYKIKTDQLVKKQPEWEALVWQPLTSSPAIHPVSYDRSGGESVSAFVELTFSGSIHLNLEPRIKLFASILVGGISASSQRRVYRPAGRSFDSISRPID